MTFYWRDEFRESKKVVDEKQQKGLFAKKNLSLFRLRRKKIPISRATPVFFCRSPTFFFEPTSAAQKTDPGCTKSPATKKTISLPPHPRFFERSWYLKGGETKWLQRGGGLEIPLLPPNQIRHLAPPHPSLSWDPGLVRRHCDRWRLGSKPPRRCRPPWEPSRLLLHLSAGCRKISENQKSSNADTANWNA